MRYSFNGHIVADSDAPILRWWGIPAACPADIRGALAENPEGEEFVLEINSGGGSVFAGFEMYSLLRNASRQGVHTRAEVWLAAPVEQPNGETDYCYTKVRTIWAAVNPTSGRTETLTGDAERAEITHRVVCRSASLPDLCREMYFVIRGQRLDVSYWLPIYNRRGWVEIYCTLRQGEVTRDGS